VAQAPPAGGDENDACAPLLRRNPSDLGFRTNSHSMTARGQAEACPTGEPHAICNTRARRTIARDIHIRAIAQRNLTARHYAKESLFG
jgi:hypothetical protein